MDNTNSRPPELLNKWTGQRNQAWEQKQALDDWEKKNNSCSEYIMKSSSILLAIFFLIVVVIPWARAKIFVMPTFFALLSLFLAAQAMRVLCMQRIRPKTPDLDEYNRDIQRLAAAMELEVWEVEVLSLFDSSSLRLKTAISLGAITGALSCSVHQRVGQEVDEGLYEKYKKLYTAAAKFRLTSQEKLLSITELVS